MSFSKDDWAALSASSGWSAMKRYLTDNRAKLMEQIAEGTFGDKSLSEAIIRCQNLKDLAEMDWETIRKFYGLPEENATKPIEVTGYTPYDR